MENITIEDDKLIRAAFIAILMTYLDLVKVYIEPEERLIVFCFLTSLPEDEKIFEDGANFVVKSLELYNHFEGYDEGHCGVVHDGFMLKVKRDIDTMSSKEIALIVELVREKFGEYINREDIEVVIEEAIPRDDFVNASFGILREQKKIKGYIAIREETHVMIFDEEETE